MEIHKKYKIISFALALNALVTTLIIVEILIEKYKYKKEMEVMFIGIYEKEISIIQALGALTSILGLLILLIFYKWRVPKVNAITRSRT